MTEKMTDYGCETPAAEIKPSSSRASPDLGDSGFPNYCQVVTTANVSQPNPVHAFMRLAMDIHHTRESRALM